MQTIQKTIRLHPAQAEFRRSPSLYRGFVGGRGAGKSFVGAYDLIRRARRGRTYLVGSPTGVMLSDTTFPTFKALAQELGVWPLSPADVRLTPYPTVKLSTGATVRFRTAEDPERMRGPNLSGAWLDEGSLMPEDAYKIVIACLRESGEQGWLSSTFTPKGKYHWTYETFAKGRPNTALVRSHTRENPFNPAGFADTLAGQYTPQFARQELGGEFIEIEGAEFPGDWFPESMWFDDWPKDLALLVLALDPSKGRSSKHGDYSAIVALGRSKDGTLWAEADMARRPTTVIRTDSEAFFERLARETGRVPDGFGCESDQFQELLADQLAKQLARRYGQIVYKMGTGNTAKDVRIRRLTPELASRKIRFRATPGTRLLVQQLQEFPIGEHDDGPDALEYARRLAIYLWNGKRGTP